MYGHGSEYGSVECRVSGEVVLLQADSLKRGELKLEGILVSFSFFCVESKVKRILLLLFHSLDWFRGIAGEMVRFFLEFSDSIRLYH